MFAAVIAVGTVAVDAADSWQTSRGWPWTDWQTNGFLSAECPSEEGGSTTVEAMECPCRDLEQCLLMDSFPALRVHGPWDFEIPAVNFAGPSGHKYESSILGET